MSENEGNKPSIFTPLSHSQSADPSAPSLFTPVQDPFGKTYAPLVQQPLPEKK